MSRHNRLLLFLVLLALSRGSMGRAEQPATAGRRQPTEATRTDSYGDPLPPGAVARIGTLRWRVGLTNFTGLSMSRDGAIAALQREDYGVSLWVAATGKEVTWFKPDLSMTAVRFAPDGKTLLIAKRQPDGKRGDDGNQKFRWTIEHREVGTGELKKSVEVTSSTSSKPLKFPQFTRDGKFFLGKLSKDFTGLEGGSVILWDASTGEKYAEVRDEAIYFDRFAVSPGGKMLAFSAGDGALSFRELPGRRELRKSPRLGDPPWGDQFGLTFSPDGRTLAASRITRESKTLFFWDVEGGKLRHKVEDCGGLAAFSPDGKSLVCAEEKAFRLFDTTTFKELRSFERNDDGARCLDFSADGKRLLSGHDNLIAVWDVGTGKRLSAAPGHDTSITSLAFSPDGRSLASGAWGGTAYVWDQKTGRPRHRFPGHSGTVASLTFSPDGTVLATGDGSGGFSAGSAKVDVRLWDLGRGLLLRQFTAHRNGVCALAFSPDGKSLATGGLDEFFRVWDPATGRQRFEVRGPENHYLKTVAFSPDGRTLLVAGGKGELALWDVGEGKKLRGLGPEEDRGIGAAAFVREGRAVLTCSGGRGREEPPECRFWDVRSGELLSSVPASRDAPYWPRMALSPDGSLLAAGAAHYGKEIRLWDVESGGQVTTLPGHAEGLNALAFSPDGKTLASGGHDTTILLWDVAQARLAGLRAELGEADGRDGPLSGSSERAVTYLKDWLLRVAGAEKLVRPLLPRLDDDDFDTRQRATAAIQKLGLPAEPALREALKGALSEEARARVERVLKAVDKGRKGTADNGGRLRRVVKGLEAVDTDDARKALREMSRGDGGLTVTKLAREAAERLERPERPR